MGVIFVGRFSNF